MYSKTSAIACNSLNPTTYQVPGTRQHCFIYPLYTPIVPPVPRGEQASPLPFAASPISKSSCPPCSMPPGHPHAEAATASNTWTTTRDDEAQAVHPINSLGTHVYYTPYPIPTCLHTYITTCLPTYLHTYIHTYIHTCIHAYVVYIRILTYTIRILTYVFQSRICYSYVRVCCCCCCALRMPPHTYFFE